MASYCEVEQSVHGDAFIRGLQQAQQAPEAQHQSELELPHVLNTDNASADDEMEIDGPAYYAIDTTGDTTLTPGVRARSCSSAASDTTNDPLGEDNAQRSQPSDSPKSSNAIKCEHVGNCKGSPAASTPPSSPARDTTPSVIESIESDVQVVESKTLWAHRYLHSKAKNVLPPERPKKSRYWIGVLSPTVQPKDIRKERDLIWMKGNARITVRTVCKTVESQGVHNEDFDLVIHGETFDSEDLTCVSALDFYNDQIVIFKIIPKIITID